ncbi:MAG: hypothetical protein JWO38_5419, partial [Gemmataceae bacterium]|nr:hypothetical protein [Gemmataceae bacterium]
VYWVTISVQKGYPSVSAEAHYFLGNEAVMEEDEDPFAPDFWDSYRETAVAEAVAEITGAGYTIAAVVSDQPCNRDELPEDLVPYYDEAEDSGSCLVFIHDDEPSEEDEPGAGV